MYVQSISIEIHSEHPMKALIEAFDMLMASYRSSGQKLGKLDHYKCDKCRLVSTKSRNT